jgi:hypothetical protein
MTKKRKIVRKKGKKTDTVVVLRGCITVFAELAGIAGFFLALYTFIKEYL